MNINMVELAAKRRARLFAELGDDIDVVISTFPGNKGYLSGYHSITHDVSPHYLSAVIATRTSAILVVSASDAGPALEVVGDRDAIVRYGLFYFEATEDQGELRYDEPGFKDFETALKYAIDRARSVSGKIGGDLGNSPFLRGMLETWFGTTAIADITPQLMKVRRIKLPEEIECIRHSTKLVEDGISAILAEGKVGMSEWDFAALLCERMVAGGALPRLVSVTSGPRSALADAYPTGRKISAGELVRLDAGCFVGGFSSDMARTFFMGEPDKLTAERYAAIAAGLEEELLEVKAGAHVSTLHKTAVETVRKAGIPSYRRHHVGHGLGIGGYEQPIISENSDQVLEAGMCLCVETPFYEIGWGGMMVEDTILVTQTGYEPITTIPRMMFQL